MSADGNPALPYRVEALGRLRVASSGRDPERPLADVRVVDFGVGGVGPFAATLLAWLGADVVKVEAPNEFILDVRPTVGGLSTTYLAINQGKRSVRLDLKDEADRELARGLVADADVVIENFRPGALSRVGFGFDELSSLNPRLVYCSVTGFGGVGPLSGEPCTDPHMQAFSGFAMANADEARTTQTDSLLRLCRPRHVDGRRGGRLRRAAGTSVQWEARFGSRPRCSRR